MPSSPELIARIAAWTSSKPDRQGATVPLNDLAARLGRVLVRAGSMSCGPARAVLSSTGGRLRSWLFRGGGSALGLEGPGRSRRGAENGWNFHTARAVEGYAEPRDGSCRCEGPFRRLGNV